MGVIVYLQLTGSKITETMLRSHPYNWDLQKDYGFNAFDIFGEERETMSVTESAVEVIIEICEKDTIELFLERNPGIVITGNTAQAAEKNPRVDSKELVSLLEEKRR